MKGFVGTVISGAIGLAALYVAGKISFQAGYDIAEAEFRYEQLQRGIETKTAKMTYVNDKPIVEYSKSEEVIPKKKQSKIGMLFGMRKLFSKNWGSVVGDIIQNPENHVIEACVKGREIHVNVRPKTTERKE